MEFFIDNLVWFIVGGVIILMTVIGYFAEKTDFGNKTKTDKIKSPVKENKKKKEEKQEIKEEVKEESAPVMDTPEVTNVTPEEVSSVTDFSINNNLEVPSVTDELPVTEDLNAPLDLSNVNVDGEMDSSTLAELSVPLELNNTVVTSEPTTDVVEPVETEDSEPTVDTVEPTVIPTEDEVVNIETPFDNTPTLDTTNTLDDMGNTQETINTNGLDSEVTPELMSNINENESVITDDNFDMPSVDDNLVQNDTFVPTLDPVIPDFLPNVDDDSNIEKPILINDDMVKTPEEIDAALDSTVFDDSSIDTSFLSGIPDIQSEPITDDHTESFDDEDIWKF